MTTTVLLAVAALSAVAAVRVSRRSALADGFALVFVVGVALVLVLPVVIGDTGLLGVGLVAGGFALVAAARRASGPRARAALWAAAGAVGLGALAASGSAALQALVIGGLLQAVVTRRAHLDRGCAHPGHGHGHGHAHDRVERAHDHDHDHGHRDGGPDHAGRTHAHEDAGPAHDHEHAHAHGHHHRPPAPDRRRAWASAGALLGLVALAVTAHVSNAAGLDDAVTAFSRTFGILVLESAPALLLGYLLAGAVPWLIAPSRLRKIGQGGPIGQALRGVAFGLPLPVCSCGVLPLYATLVRGGVPTAAAMAFFVATPELGLDAVLLSVPLLGAPMTWARVVAALFVALGVAWLVGRRAAPAEGDGFVAQIGGGSRPRSLSEALRFGFGELFDHTMPWVAVGLLVAALAEPLLSHGALERLPALAQVPIAALVGVPVYVCATGATPIAALAVHKGLSAGAALAFLIAGPATNVTTFALLARLHGRRLALAFGAAVTGLAIACGWIVDALQVPVAPVLDTHALATHEVSALSWACAVALGALTAASILRQGPRGALRQILEPVHGH